MKTPIKTMTKKETKEKCKLILNKYNINERVSEEDQVFLLSVFKNHNHWVDKQGVGIAYITVESTSFYNNRCFYLNRLDGTKTDISYVMSISSPSNLEDIRKACRSAISFDIECFKEKNVIYGITKCAITNEILIKGNVHIDHYDYTFEEVFQKWIKNKDINLLAKSLKETKDMEYGTYFKDTSIIEDFRKFHNNNTHLRAVTTNANVSILRNSNMKYDIMMRELSKILDSI